MRPFANNKGGVEFERGLGLLPASRICWGQE